MKRTFHHLAFAAVLLAGGLVVTGCAEKKKPDASPNTTGGEVVEEVVAEETVVPAEPEADDLPAEPAAAKEEMPAEEAKPAEEAAEEKPAEEPAPQARTAPEPGPEVAADAGNGKIMLGADELFAGLPGEGKVKLEELEKWLADPKNHEPLDFVLPVGLAKGASEIKGVDKNPLTRAKIELGRQLYFDPRLSADESTSCASCHDPDEGFARHAQFGIGIKNQAGGRNSPVSYNRILSDKQFWDGRADTLEDQAVGPIANPIEMGNTHEACVVCLGGIPGYKLQFEKIFGRLDIDTVGQALAAFERAIVTGPTPFDYAENLKPFEQLEKEDIEADEDLKKKYDEAVALAAAHPLTESAKRGMDLYFSEKASCSACHVGANLTDEKYHNLGVGMDKEEPDVGRFEVTKDEKDTGAFKTPTIRNVALSAPYMHDGSQATLEEVVEWYAKGGHPNPHLSEKIKKLDLSEQDKKDLVEFMKQGCTGSFPKISRDRLPE